uniref:Uncharacterized protein n=1 Tax=Physcomitrium patens TaxID=3218 RepID=A0A7I3ZYF7_PHYPA
MNSKIWREFRHCEMVFVELRNVEDVCDSPKTWFFLILRCEAYQLAEPKLRGRPSSMLCNVRDQIRSVLYK